MLLTALYLLPSIILVCAEITALHLKMPHQFYCCLSNPFEIQWKTAHPQPAPASFSSQLICVSIIAQDHLEFRVECFWFSVSVTYLIVNLLFHSAGLSLNLTIAHHHKHCVLLCSDINSSLIHTHRAATYSCPHRHKNYVEVWNVVKWTACCLHMLLLNKAKISQILPSAGILRRWHHLELESVQ